MVKNKFTCSYDDMEGYLIEKQGETIEDSEVFLVTDRKEAEEITEYLNKQLEIIEALKEDSYSNVDVIRMKQDLYEML